MGSISNGPPLDMDSFRKVSSEYLCLARSNSFKVTWAYGALVVLFISGFISAMVSFGTIWMESRTAGMGVFSGCVFMLTGVLGFRAYSRKTSLIIQLVILSLLVMGAAAVVIAAFFSAVQSTDDWCRIQTLVDETARKENENRPFNEVHLADNCGAIRVIDIIIAVCSLISLLVAIVLFFVSVRGIPCGKQKTLDE